jgi:hypothetical protein
MEDRATWICLKSLLLFAGPLCILMLFIGVFQFLEWVEEVVTPHTIMLVSCTLLLQFLVSIRFGIKATKTKKQFHLRRKIQHGMCAL